MPNKPREAAEFCPRCRSQRIKVDFRPYQASVGKNVLAFTDEFSKCEDCGEEFYTFEQSQAHSRSLTEALQEKEKFPIGAKIKEIRSRLGMSQEVFEQALDVGKNTSGRWERGTVAPAAGIRGLLWIAEHQPAAFWALAKARGVRTEPVTVQAAVSGSVQSAPSAKPRSLPSGVGLTTTGRVLAFPTSATQPVSLAPTDKEDQR